MTHEQAMAKAREIVDYHISDEDGFDPPSIEAIIKSIALALTEQSEGYEARIKELERKIGLFSTEVELYKAQVKALEEKNDNLQDLIDYREAR